MVFMDIPIVMNITVVTKNMNCMVSMAIIVITAINGAPALLRSHPLRSRPAY